MTLQQPVCHGSNVAISAKDAVFISIGKNNGETFLICSYTSDVSILTGLTAGAVKFTQNA
jgi:hypothetical protein